MPSQGNTGGLANVWVGQSAVRDYRESDEVPMITTAHAGADRALYAPASSDDATSRSGDPEHDEGDEMIELPVSRRVVQRPPREQDVVDEDGIIGLPADVLQIEHNDDADEEMIGLPSQIPAGAVPEVQSDEDEEEMVPLPGASLFPAIPPPAPSEPWGKRTIDEVDLDAIDLDEEIIYPNNE